VKSRLRACRYFLDGESSKESASEGLLIEKVAFEQEDERELVKLTCSAEESSYVESDVEAELMRETLDYLLENEGGFAERNTPSGAPHSLHASGDGKSSGPNSHQLSVRLRR